MKVRIAAHNLRDEAGTPTFIGSIMFFTEAEPDRVRELLPRGWDMAVCAEQRDLVIAWDMAVFTPRARRPISYRRKVKGEAKVSPNRGTFVLKGHLSSGRKAALVVSHRINAAFPPFKRGEAKFRSRAWERHTAYDVRLVKRLKRFGWVVLAGGDLNTPKHVSGWRGSLNEVSTSLDRLGSSEPLSDFRRYSRAGSDHHRIAATADIT